jgi:hypothetical protein
LAFGREGHQKCYFLVFLQLKQYSFLAWFHTLKVCTETWHFSNSSLQVLSPVSDKCLFTSV